MDHETLNKLLGNVNKQDLIKLIGVMIQSDGKAEEILLEYCQKKSPPESVSLADENMLIRYWQNAWQIIDDANTYGGCSDEDENEAYDELAAMEKLVREKRISWACRRGLLDKIMVQVGYNNSGFTDQLVDLAELFCQTDDEWQYLAECLAQDGNTYNKAKAAAIYREIGADDKFLETKTANLTYGSDYLDLADYYVEHGDDDKALKIVWTGFERCDGHLDGIYFWLFERYNKDDDEKALWELYEKALERHWSVDCIAELMYGYCKQKGDYSGQKRTLFQLVNACQSSAAKKWYDQCQHDLQPEDWKQAEPLLLQVVKKKSIEDYLEISLLKGKNKEVLDYIQHTPTFYNWRDVDRDHRFSKKLIKIYPEVILQRYWDEVHSLIKTSREKNYYQATTILAEIAAYMTDNGQEDAWQKRYDALLADNSRRKLFLKIVKRI